MKNLKKNVESFNRDVNENKGYRYTVNAPFSSVVANKRLTQSTIENIEPSCRSLIDIGCGDGTYTNEIKRVFKGMRIEGTDPAIKAVAAARKKYPGIGFFVSNILDRGTFGHKKKKFDVGVIRGVLHHLGDPAAAIRNSFLLAGRLIIIEPNGSNPILKVIEKTSKYHVEHEERSFSLTELRGFCNGAGGEIIKISFAGYVPFFFPEIPARIIYFFQPVLERIPVLRYFFSAQIIIVCVKKKKVRYAQHP
jgi:SAM-dependent methyltransferase